MCKHVLNAQVAVRAPCCRKWFECPECHREASDHPLKKTNELVFACKKCKKVFRKDATDFQEQDEFCPHCDNHYILPAKEPQLAIGIEADDVRAGGAGLLKDDRVKPRHTDS